jgi:Polyketide cyclase / dehydrase and lipid transport
VGVAGGVVLAAPWLALNHAVLPRYSLIYAVPIVFCVRMLWPGNRYLRYSSSISINRSPSDVSAFLADARNAVTWQGPQLRSMSILSGEPGTRGAIYRGLVVTESGQTFQGDTKLDEYRPGQMLRWRNLNTEGPATLTETTTLQLQGSGTHLTRSVSSQYEWREAIIQTWEDPLGSDKRARRKQMVAMGDAFLAKLKSVLEGGLT